MKKWQKILLWYFGIGFGMTLLGIMFGTIEVGTTMMLFTIVLYPIVMISGLFQFAGPGNIPLEMMAPIIASVILSGVLTYQLTKK